MLVLFLYQENANCICCIKAPKKSTAKTKTIAKADWKEGFKKKQVGVADMTMLSKVNNEAINENLRKRFENAEIYVSDFEKDLLVKDKIRSIYLLFRYRLGFIFNVYFIYQALLNI